MPSPVELGPVAGDVVTRIETLNSIWILDGACYVRLPKSGEGGARRFEDRERMLDGKRHPYLGASWLFCLLCRRQRRHGVLLRAFTSLACRTIRSLQLRTPLSWYPHLVPGTHEWHGANSHIHYGWYKVVTLGVLTNYGTPDEQAYNGRECWYLKRGHPRQPVKGCLGAAQ